MFVDIKKKNEAILFDKYKNERDIQTKRLRKKKKKKKVSLSFVFYLKENYDKV